MTDLSNRYHISRAGSFLVISIPLADGRQSEKPGFTGYRAETRMLLPIPRRSR